MSPWGGSSRPSPVGFPRKKIYKNILHAAVDAATGQYTEK